MEISAGDLRFVWPSIACFAFGMLVLLGEVVMGRRSAAVSTGVTAFGLLFALGVNLMIGPEAAEPRVALGGMVAFDTFGVVMNCTVFLAALGSLLVGHDYLRRIDVAVPEYNALILFAASGMSLLSVSNDLMMLFVALELMSIALYVLCAINRGELRSVEAAAKYFILGAFAAALLLYGIAFVYGAVGTTRLDFVRDWLVDGHRVADSGLLSVGLALLVVGFGFKVAAAPFHMWSPDVYQGAPTPVTSLMATGVKAASFAAFARVMFVAFLPAQHDWAMAIWGISALTILWGNIGALVQRDLKRMLAYSSIGHAGYLLMPFVGASGESLLATPRVGGLLFYLISYTVMTVGAFAVLSLMTRDGADDTDVDQLNGLASRHPMLAAGLALCLLSLAGVPPTMGFVGKFYLFAAAVEGGHVGLAVVGAIGGAIGVYYYLRPIVHMYMRPTGDARAPSLNMPALGALALSAVAILAFGLMPGPLVDWCRDALRTLAG